MSKMICFNIVTPPDLGNPARVKRRRARICASKGLFFQRPGAAKTESDLVAVTRKLNAGT
jgi:hypothetical protein